MMDPYILAVDKWVSGMKEQILEKVRNPIPSGSGKDKRRMGADLAWYMDVRDILGVDYK